VSPVNFKFARKSRFAAGLWALSVVFFCHASSGRDIALYSLGQREIIRVSYAAASLTASQPEFDEFESASAELIGLKYTFTGRLNSKNLDVAISIPRRGESSMVLFHRKLPSRYNYNSSAALQTGYGKLFPASRLGQCRTDGAGPEDLGFFYLKMCLRF
jgi:hypothetical protein